MSGCVYRMTRHVFMYLDMSRHIFVILMVFSIAPLHSLGHNNKKIGENYIFRHVMPLLPALLSYDANRIINDITLLIR